jgi:hypothetical protein
MLMWFGSWHSLRASASLAAACALSACGTASVSRYENEGELCFRSTPADQLEVKVRFDTCLSSSCSREIETSCSISVAGGQISVSSRGSVERKGGTCTDDCGELAARCLSEPLAAGVYQLRHGAASSEVTLPAEGALSAGSDGGSCRW